jgi:hypothetical protein
MNPERRQMQIHGIAVEVWRKPIRNLHLRVYPPDGRVRVSVPTWMDDQTLCRAISSKMLWIERQQRRFSALPREPERAVVTGESHFYRGRLYVLEVVESPGRSLVRLAGKNSMILRVPLGAETSCRRRILERWYRKELQRQIQGLAAVWEPVIGRQAAEWRIKRMKTRWGSCNIAARRIWLNLELIKKPPACLEYVLVHEMIHLLERRHNEHFYGLMDRFMPDWRLRRKALSRTVPEGVNGEYPRGNALYVQGKNT